MPAYGNYITNMAVHYPDIARTGQDKSLKSSLREESILVGSTTSNLFHHLETQSHHTLLQNYRRIQMAIKKKSERISNMIEIDITGPEGNAYVLMGYAAKLCKKLGYDHDRKERILDEMRLTDYEGLLHTFDREFGTLVTLWR